MNVHAAVTVVIPMAGDGHRFREAGYQLPKPFVDVRGAAMIERIIENIALPDARYILIARQEHIEAQQQIVADLERRYPCEFVTLSQKTEGTAATILFARHRFRGDRPLLIANADQLVDGGCAEMVRHALERELDGCIMTFEEPTRNPKWSFARVDDRGFVVEVREKVAISTHATVGIYYFRRGDEFVDAATQMIISNDRTNGEFYTCPVYNYLIAMGRKVGTWEIPAACMHGLGTPADLIAYLARHAPALG